MGWPGFADHLTDSSLLVAATWLRPGERCQIQGCSSRRDGARWVENVERLANRMDLNRFREEERVTGRSQVWHRRVPGPGVDASLEEHDRHRRLSGAQRPRAGARRRGDRHCSRFPCQVVDQGLDQRREPTQIGPGLDPLRATALGTGRGKQGRSQEQYDRSCRQRDQLLERREPCHSSGHRVRLNKPPPASEGMELI